MANKSRKTQIFVCGIILVLSGGLSAVAFSSYENHGATFTSCRVTGCSTNLSIAAGSGLLALVALFGLLGACFRRDDDYNPYKD